MIGQLQRTMLTTSIVLVLAVVSRQVLGVTQGCMEIPTETNVDADDVVGTWYPMEVVLHRSDSKIYGVPTDTDCPMATFTTTRNKKTLFMVWNSTEGHLEYNFTHNKGSKGQWQSSDQTGGKATILTLEKDKYMIIRDCSNSVHNTVVLSKPIRMSQDLMNEANNEIAKLVKFPSLEKKYLCSSASLVKNMPTYVMFASISILVLLLRQYE
uniref:Lipocalin/cytosolic fatty-acid binding domain-containing protein n=1 Tax=Graphocephala atropunctata TaxID=36148 RepID=A0A1B6KBI6_9HEMI